MKRVILNISRAAFMAVLLFLMVIPVCAEDNKSDLTQEEIDNTLVIEEVEVEGKVSEESVEGKTVITRDIIDRLPRGNGDITDTLSIAPGVQFDDKYNSSMTGGEIEPARISISGGKDYQNLFLIDGMTNSSYINPAEDNPYITDEVKGHPQKFFVDANMVEKVTVYDSNVPVEFSGFLGGVVDVETRKPSKDLWGSISYRTTRSEWSNMYIDSYRKREFYNNNNTSKRQPKFEKHYYNATINAPINEKSAIILGYKRLESEIPVRFYNEWNTEERMLETYTLKGKYDFDRSRYVDATITYSPFTETRFLPNTLNSKYTYEGGGFFTSFNYKREQEDRDLEIHADYSVSSNSREANNIHYKWAATDTKPWGLFADTFTAGPDGNVSAVSQEGGFGDIENEEKVFNLKLNHEIGRYKLAGSHLLSYGVHYSNISGTEDKTETSYSYTSATINRDVICGNNTIDCIEGEQYFRKLEVSPAYSGDASINQINIYGQDSYDFWRMNLRLGLRYTYDDYMENHDISYRSAFEYDIFDNKKTVLVFGYNRYYGSNLLKNKLRESKPYDKNYVRSTYWNEVKDWERITTSADTLTKFSNLKTPYSDEYMGGIAQYLFGGTFNIKGIVRENRDEFASEKFTDENGAEYRRLNNNGESSFKSVQVKWDRKWTNHYLMMNLMWSDSRTGQDNYNDEYDLDELDELVYYKGELIKVSELPKNNFNRPIIINLTYTGRFFKHLTISPSIKYRASYQQIVLTDSARVIGLTGEIDPDTGEKIEETVSEYKKVEFDPSIMTNVRFAWTQNIYGNHRITISLDVNNIFDKKIVNNYASDGGVVYEEYEMGRSFWAGVEYAF